MLKILLIFNLALLVSAKPDPCWGDSDCDGILNEFDTDDDNDGIHDDIDWDHDNDGINDHHGGGYSHGGGLSPGGNYAQGITLILICVFVPLGFLIILIALVCYCGCC